MNASHKVMLGIGLIIAGVVVAVVGWFGVSGETDVAFQLPFIASAGVGALLLFGGGATALITAQLEGDGERLREIEDAIRLLAIEVGRLNDELAPPREGAKLRAIGRRRSGS